MAARKKQDLELPPVLNYQQRDVTFLERLQHTKFKDFVDWCGGGETIGFWILFCIIVTCALLLSAIGQSFPARAATFALILLFLRRPKYGPY